jgi:N-acyl-D-amino-acid deacylase
VYGTGQSVPRPDGGFYLEAMDSHGGWVASTVDYLRFMLSVDGRTDHPDILTESSIATLNSRPTFSHWAGTPAWYGMGWWVRPSGNDANWWHAGNLPGTATYMVRSYENIDWVMFFNSKPADEDSFFNEVDAAGWNAIAGVTSWPSNDLFGSFATCSSLPRRQAVRH